MNDSNRRKLLGVERVPHLGIRHPVYARSSREERAAYRRAELQAQREHEARSPSREELRAARRSRVIARLKGRIEGRGRKSKPTGSHLRRLTRALRALEAA